MHVLTLFTFGLFMLVVPTRPAQSKQQTTDREVGWLKGYFVSQIAPFLWLNTDVNMLDPYVGQQFSVVYSLTAFDPPMAVDIQPQQYHGFWSQVVPLPRESRIASGELGGKPVFNYLLRQVVVSPIFEGQVKLPPLKIKLRIQRDFPRPVQGTSDPIEIEVRPLPKCPFGLRGSPLVGQLKGKIYPDPSGGTRARLELEGTANLAFFDPARWLDRGGSETRIRLRVAESRVQVRDLAGRRSLTTVRRYEWGLHPGTGGSLRPGLQVPTFNPLDGGWKVLKIASSSPLQAQGVEVQADEPASLSVPSRRLELVTDSLLYGGLLLVLVAAGSLWWHRRQIPLREETVPVMLASLEKQAKSSPRFFLETARRILDRYAAQDINDADADLQTCRRTVEAQRFRSTEPTPEMRQRILRKIHSLTEGHERSSEAQKSG